MKTGHVLMTIKELVTPDGRRVMPGTIVDLLRSNSRTGYDCHVRGYGVYFLSSLFLDLIINPAEFLELKAKYNL